MEDRNLRLSHVFVFVALTLIALKASSGYSANASSSPQANTAEMARENWKSSRIISFSPKMSQLSVSDRDSLRKFVSEARVLGKIRLAEVAVWSDKPFPRDSELNRADRKLAEERGFVLRNYIRGELGVPRVDVYNMATRAGPLAKLFGTREAELKSAFGQKGGSPPLPFDQYRILKEEGRPSAAVVILRVR